jgi:osmotically-inducible protein OsmY
MLGDESDKRTRDAVVRELDWDPRLSTHGIAVSAKDGAVVLSGNVHSYADRLAAVRAAERIYGVRVVADEIEVKLPASAERKDEEVAQEISRVMTYSSGIPSSVKAEVSRGQVTLSGDVEWAYQSNEAARAVRFLAGVTNLNNMIQVKAKLPKVAEVTRSVHEALGRLADLDARSVWVTSSDGAVHLHGHVHSLSEWQAAGRAAAAAPGMTQVINEISVTP